MQHQSSLQQTRRQESFKQQQAFKQQDSVERTPSQQPRPGRSSQSHQFNKPESLNDRDLLSHIRLLVQTERELLTNILHHLKEVERRKLYSDLGYKSLFDYAVGELSYSEGQAGRRIQAMKLLRELPQVEQQALEQKIESGALNLSNICQAQSFFNQVKKAAPEGPLNTEQKIEVLKELEHKSTRQGQVALLQRAESAGAGPLLPKEKERVLSSEYTELRLVLSADQLARLEEVRGLLGQKALGMSWAEQIDEMATLSLDALKDKKFGKRRDIKSSSTPKPTESICSNGIIPPSGVIPPSRDDSPPLGATPLMGPAPSAEADSMNAPALTTEETYSLGATATTKSDSPVEDDFPPTSIKDRVKVGPDLGGRSFGGRSAQKPAPKARSISKGKRYRVWERDGGGCVKCGAKDGLQVDHVIPVAHGGGCEEENLRLMCGNCNIREGIKDFGLEKMKRSKGTSEVSPTPK